MAALPKRKPSKHRKGRRRSQQGLSAPSTTICAQCGGEKLPHLACPHCGSWENKTNEKAKKTGSKTSKKKKGN